MQTIIIFLIAIIISLVLVEIFVSVVIGYHRYDTGTRKFQINRKLGQYDILILRPPGYKFWSVEGGNRVFKFNNIGLPGSDVKLPLNSHNVFLLGSSFIESMNVDRMEASSAVFQKELDDNRGNYNVMNLGCSGHDPYVMWFRSQFFQRRFAPEYVILVIDPSSVGYLKKRWTDSLLFDIPDGLPRELPQSSSAKYSSILRKYSSLSNMIIQGLAAHKNRNDAIAQNAGIENSIRNEAWSKLNQCIARFKQSYGDKLLILSIVPDKLTNIKINSICEANGCSFYSEESILKPENRVNGTGHLNTQGNQLLGQYLFKSILKFERNK